MQIQVGMVVFSESLTRNDVYLQRKPIQDREVRKAVDALERGMNGDSFRIVMAGSGEVRSKKDVRLAVQEMNCSPVEAVILYVPIFITPSMVSLAAGLLHKPVLVMGNTATDTLSQLGFLASCGAMDQQGLPYKRFLGDVDNENFLSSILRYVKAIHVGESLRGLTFGCVGGRSLGISTGTADVAQWQKQFGVDIEHIDQLEIVRRAERVSADDVARYIDWIRANYGKICYKEGRFDDARLEKMVRSYLAVKSLIADYELDFMGVKCQPEMSNGYALQCLTVQLLNDPYDADGAKETVPTSCEADCDGALTMQILKTISGGKATALQDIAYISDQLLVLANCGSMASYFASCSEDPAENLQEVYLQPHAFGQAGGAATQFVVHDGVFTFARLMRRNGNYWMAILRGETEKRPREALNEYSWYRPTSFVKVSIDAAKMFETYGSNHMHCVYGDYVRDLIDFCEYKGIPYIVY